MEFISILNDVLGPVMRGPSSSHTAGSYHIGRIARSLLGEPPASALFMFDPDGSYIKTYDKQAADQAFAAGIMEWPLTDDRFAKALDFAASQGIRIDFRAEPLEYADHPNTVKIHMSSKSGNFLTAIAKSVGGGGVVFSRLEGWPVSLNGKSYAVIVHCDESSEPEVNESLFSDKEGHFFEMRETQGKEILLSVFRTTPLEPAKRRQIEAKRGVKRIWTAAPVFYVQRGEPLFLSAEQMVHAAKRDRKTLGGIALAYEAQLLGIPESEVLKEIERRYEVMSASLQQGLREEDIHMKLLRPTARKICQAESEGRVAIGGLHTKVAAGAMAVMHVSNSIGIVCAAPTGGSAGVISSVVVTLAAERKLNSRQAAMALLAAGAVGLIILRRATFAAEVAGCQVEIGAAGAMAAAAVVEIAGGHPGQAVDAAAISLQNTMGSVCDLVQGICEIPCHTRNAVAASSAFICADLILGGYENPISLDETIDAVFSSGNMLPPELRCTALGGLATTPSGRSLPLLRR